MRGAGRREGRGGCRGEEGGTLPVEGVGVCAFGARAVVASDVQRWWAGDDERGGAGRGVGGTDGGGCGVLTAGGYCARWTLDGDLMVSVDKLRRWVVACAERGW